MRLTNLLFYFFQGVELVTSFRADHVNTGAIFCATQSHRQTLALSTLTAILIISDSVVALTGQLDYSTCPTFSSIFLSRSALFCSATPPTVLVARTWAICQIDRGLIGNRVPAFYREIRYIV